MLYFDIPSDHTKCIFHGCSLPERGSHVWVWVFCAQVCSTQADMPTLFPYLSLEWSHSCQQTIRQLNASGSVMSGRKTDSLIVLSYYLHEEKHVGVGYVTQQQVAHVLLFFKLCFLDILTSYIKSKSSIYNYNFHCVVSHCDEAGPRCC